MTTRTKLAWTSKSSKCVSYVRPVLHVLLILTFLGIVNYSLTKYMAKKVSISQKSQHDHALLFPSVTICPLYVERPPGSDLPDAKRNMTAEYENLPSFKQIVTKLVHVYEDEKTKKTVNFTAVWSKVDEGESGEGERGNLYTTVIPWLKKEYKGQGIQQCLTYDPLGKSKQGGDNSLVLNLTGVSHCLVTLHNKYHMVPGAGKYFGSTFIYSNSPGGGMRYSSSKVRFITKTDMKYLDNSESGSCVDDGEETGLVDFHECLQGFIEGQLDCVMPWHAATGKGRPCDVWSEYKKYLDSYTNFTAMDEMVLVQMTNCRPSCQRTMYKTTKISSLNYMPQKDESREAHIKVFYASSRYYVREQYFTYDIHSLISDFGGNLGLLLGYSILNLFDSARGGLDSLCGKIRTRQKH